jgi:replicative DNA helicase
LWLLDKSLNDADLVAIINLLSESRNIGGVFIDYIQKIAPSNPTNQDWLNIKNVSQAILDCAVSLDIPIVLGCQLNRATEGTNDKRPQLGTLRQSGDLEQDANLVLGLYRDEFYNPESFDKGILEVSILKNRNGSTRGVGKLQFTPETLKITDISSSRLEDDYQF